MNSQLGTTTDKVNQKLPIGQTITLGLQHVLAMYAGAVAIPLIIGGALNFTPQQLAILVAADLFTCGIATIIQTYGIGDLVGIKLPVVLGCTFTAIGPMIGIAASSEAGITSVYGSIIVAGIFIVIVSQFIGKILKFFPQVVTGCIVTIIGLALMPTAFNNAAGGYSPSYGNPMNFLLATITMIIIIIVNRYFKGFLQAIAVLIGLIGGTIVASFMGMVSLSAVSSAQWVSIVRPFAFGLPKFEIGAIITMCIVLLVVMVESLGTFLAVGELCDKPVTSNDLVKGYRAEGLSTIIGGIFNCFPYTTYYQNLGLIAITKVTSRYVVVAAGIILIILGCIPKFATLVTIIPSPVLGGAMIIMFTMVTVAGIQMLQKVDFKKNSNMMVAACSIGIGVGISVVPDLFAQFPEMFRTIFGQSGIVPGALIAVFLNLILNYEDLVNSQESKASAPEHGTIL